MKTNTSTIHLVRHGAVYNPNRIYYGRMPLFGLSDEGKQQAQFAANYFKGGEIAALYTSPLLRARQTAKIIAAGHQATLTPHITRHIIEVHSPYDGWPLEVMESRNWDLYTGTGPEYEQPEDLVSRIKTFFNRVRQQHHGKQVIAVTHGDIVVFATIWAHGFPAKQHSKSQLAAILPDFYPSNCGIASFTFTHDAPDKLPEYAYTKPY